MGVKDIKYNELVKEYYGDINNLVVLLKTLTDSYRLMIGGAFELNNIPEARTRYVKAAVNRADKLGDIIDNLIDLIDKCDESYFQYCSTIGEYILKKKDDDLILTEIENELFFQNSSGGIDLNIREEEEDEI